MNTYSEQLLEDYPTLGRASVAKLLREHGMTLDELDADFERVERYNSAAVMAWLGY